MKPQQSRVEIDLAVETSAENYDEDAPEHLKIKTQVGLPLTFDYICFVIGFYPCHLRRKVLCTRSEQWHSHLELILVMFLWSL